MRPRGSSHSLLFFPRSLVKARWWLLRCLQRRGWASPPFSQAWASAPVSARKEEKGQREHSSSAADSLHAVLDRILCGNVLTSAAPCAPCRLRQLGVAAGALRAAVATGSGGDPGGGDRGVRTRSRPSEFYFIFFSQCTPRIRPGVSFLSCAPASPRYMIFPPAVAFLAHGSPLGVRTFLWIAFACAAVDLVLVFAVAAGGRGLLRAGGGRAAAGIGGAGAEGGEGELARAKAA